eukprot:GEZU01042388.1.p2 GENE.GEZU01042388.1~~GEZU01042388.1.p2  ORF type:complete len:350 (+),score=94.24 GEZU01042388.1:44-1051(+)
MVKPSLVVQTVGFWLADFVVLASLYKFLKPLAIPILERFLATPYDQIHPLVITSYWGLLIPCLLFWIISTCVGGHSGIFDPHWALSPFLFSMFYSDLPQAAPANMRTAAVTLVGLVYGLRLNYNYFRTVGLRHFLTETDWRYEEIKAVCAKLGLPWWFCNFLLVFVTQYLMIFLGSLPIYCAYIYGGDKPFGVIDALATITSLAAVTIEGFADSQLQRYQERKAEGKPVPEVLDSGLWYYSRHPNYFGESLFWFGLFLFSVSVGQYWSVIGPLNILALFLGYSIRAVEKKMHTNAAKSNNVKKKRALEEYAKVTSPFIPFFKLGKTSSSNNNRKQ